MSDDLVLVENFAEWRKAVKNLDAGLEKELKAGLREIGKKVSSKAKSEATARGLVQTGELVRKIAPTVRAKDVAIVAKAKRPATSGNRPSNGKRSRYAGKPFAYPAVWEYGGRLDGNTTGPRAFLAPAVEKSSALIRSELEKVMDQTARNAGWK